MDETRELLLLQAKLYHLKGRLPLVAHHLNIGQFQRADDWLLQLAQHLDTCEDSMSEWESPTGEPYDSLFLKIRTLFFEVATENESVQLQIARWWLAAGSPSPRPACLMSFQMEHDKG